MALFFHNIQGMGDVIQLFPSRPKSVAAAAAAAKDATLDGGAPDKTPEPRFKTLSGLFVSTAVYAMLPLPEEKKYAVIKFKPGSSLPDIVNDRQVARHRYSTISREDAREHYMPLEGDPLIDLTEIFNLYFREINRRPANSGLTRLYALKAREVTEITKSGHFAFNDLGIVDAGMLTGQKIVKYGNGAFAIEPTGCSMVRQVPAFRPFIAPVATI
jgi:hypothetical protein